MDCGVIINNEEQTRRKQLLKKLQLFFIGSIFMMLSIIACGPQENVFRLTDLSVDYINMPLGIDVTTPRFSWQMVATDTNRGYEQSAYRIVVSDSQHVVVWDSAKVTSGLSLA